jgi:hypothetical protein
MVVVMVVVVVVMVAVVVVVLVMMTVMITTITITITIVNDRQGELYTNCIIGSKQYVLGLQVPMRYFVQMAVHVRMLH